MCSHAWPLEGVELLPLWPGGRRWANCAGPHALVQACPTHGLHVDQINPAHVQLWKSNIHHFPGEVPARWQSLLPLKCRFLASVLSVPLFGSWLICSFAPSVSLTHLPRFCELVFPCALPFLRSDSAFRGGKVCTYFFFISYIAACGSILKQTACFFSIQESLLRCF